jgi:hypothetical protein
MVRISIEDRSRSSIRTLFSFTSSGETSATSSRMARIWEMISARSIEIFFLSVTDNRHNLLCLSIIIP